MRAVIVCVCLSGAVALATGTTNMVDQDNTLTTIDQVPTKPQLDQVFGTNALASLASIATDPDDGIDQGVRLRAIHALAKYCGGAPGTPCGVNDLAHQSVLAVITQTRTAQSGTPVLVLRAAIETLGEMRVASDVTTLTPLLDHPSRDIRAATARSLRDLCNPQAITPLRTRYSNEMTDQVKLAISEALRILGQCTVNP
jgi:HEAT repeat protein